MKIIHSEQLFIINSPFQVIHFSKKYKFLYMSLQEVDEM